MINREYARISAVPANSKNWLSRTSSLNYILNKFTSNGVLHFRWLYNDWMIDSL